jgi:hypothetical protein
MSERLTEERIAELMLYLELHCCDVVKEDRSLWKSDKHEAAIRGVEAHMAAQQAEITRLVARVGELEAALLPFEDMYDRYQRGTHWSDPYLYDNMVEPIRVAAQALANGEQA